MTLQHWIWLWQVVLIGGIVSFAILAVVVTVGGFFDVRRLFQMLRAQQETQSTEEDLTDGR